MDLENRYSPTRPTENSPGDAVLERLSRSPNRYSPTNPTEDIDLLEDIFRIEENHVPEKADEKCVLSAEDSVSDMMALGEDDNHSVDSDSENRLVIQEEPDEEKEEVEGNGLEEEERVEENESEKAVDLAHRTQTDDDESVDHSEVEENAVGDKAFVTLCQEDHENQQREPVSQKEMVDRPEVSEVLSLNTDEPVKASGPGDNCGGDVFDILQLTADNDLEARDSGERSKRKGSKGDSSDAESIDSPDKSKDSCSDGDHPVEYDRSPDYESSLVAGEDLNQNETDKESSGEVLDEENSAEDCNRSIREQSVKDNKSQASVGENSDSGSAEDGIDIIEMSVDLDDKEDSSELRFAPFENNVKSSPALGVTRVIQRASMEKEVEGGGDSRTVQAIEDDSEDDVQIIECPPQEPIDTLIVDDDDDDDDVVAIGSGGPKKSASERPRIRKSKKKRTVEKDGHDLRIVIREERRDREDSSRSRRRHEKRSHGRGEERRSDSHRRSDGSRRTSDHLSRRQRHRSHSHSRDRRRSRRTRSRSHSLGQSSRRRHHREHERSSEREREREKSRRRKRHDRSHEHRHKSRSKSHSPKHRRLDREESWDKENHEERSNREASRRRRRRGHHYHHREESGREESPVIERKRKKHARDKGDSPGHERRRRRHEESPAQERNRRKYEELSSVERRNRRQQEEPGEIVERRSRRHGEERRGSPLLERRSRRHMEQQEESPVVQKRSKRHVEEHDDSFIVKRKSRRHIDEWEESPVNERKRRGRRQMEVQEESPIIERHRRHVEERNESPDFDRNRRHFEQFEESPVNERKHRRLLEAGEGSSSRRKRGRTRHLAENWEESSEADSRSRKYAEREESPVIERKRVQHSTWSPSDTFQKDPSDSSDSEQSSSQESEGSDRDESEEQEEVERQVVLVHREEEEGQMVSSESSDSSERETEEVEPDDVHLSKPEDNQVSDSEIIPVEEPADSSSPESEQSHAEESREPSIPAEEPLENPPEPTDHPHSPPQKTEDLSPEPVSQEEELPVQKSVPEEIVYDPAHPTESESERVPALSSVNTDISDSAQPPGPAEGKDARVVQGKAPLENSSEVHLCNDSLSSKPHNHLMMNPVLLSRTPTGSGPLSGTPSPPRFRLQIGGPSGISIQNQFGQRLPSGPPPPPQGLSDQLSRKSENEPQTTVSQFSVSEPSGRPELLNIASSPTLTCGMQNSAHQPLLDKAGKERPLTQEKFDKTLSNMVVAQNFLTVTKDGKVGDEPSSRDPPSSVFKIPPPPKSPIKSSSRPRSIAGSCFNQEQSGDSTELMDMDMSPLEDECELELPTPPDLSDMNSEDRRKTAKPPLPRVDLKALTNAIKRLTSQPADDMPTSAVELTNKEKYLKKLHLQERVVDEVKQALRPFYNHKKVTKEEYKQILRKAVPKVCHSKSGDINPQKIQQLVKGYVNKYQKHRHSKKDRAARGSKEKLKANGERGKASR